MACTTIRPEPARGLSGALLRHRHAFAQAVSRQPAIYLPLARLYVRISGRHENVHVLTPRTDLVIEGFPRSANSFAIAAFRHAQPGPVRIAHALHTPAHVIQAVRWQIPVLICLREPAAAILSYAVYSPHLVIEGLLKEYVNFHEAIRDYRAGFVAATFEQTTLDFGGVCRRLNRKYNRSFGVFEHTKENVDKCFERITGEHHPSGERDQLKAEIRAELQNPRLRAIRERAQQLYTEFRGYAEAGDASSHVQIRDRIGNMAAAVQ